ncbi:unnamed protein product, partial [Chrysoparadoxa australica]
NKVYLPRPLPSKRGASDTSHPLQWFAPTTLCTYCYALRQPKLKRCKRCRKQYSAAIAEGKARAREQGEAVSWQKLTSLTEPATMLLLHCAHSSILRKGIGVS